MLRAEISLLFRRLRIKVLLGVLVLVPVIVAVAVRLSGSGPDPGEGPQFLDQLTHNGVFAALVGLTITLPIFLPLAVAVVAGDTIAGEANLGTLRYLLTRPCGRTRLLVVKGVTVLLFCVVASLTVAIAGLVTGAVLFPIGSLTTLSGTTLPLVEGMAGSSRPRSWWACRCSGSPPSGCSCPPSPTRRSARWLRPQELPC